jgi:hypothetical protein
MIMEGHGYRDTKPHADPLNQQEQSQKLKYEPVIKHGVC